MSSSTRPSGRAAGSVPSQRSSRSATTASAPPRVRSTAPGTASTAEPPKARAPSSRRTAPSSSPAPSQAPTLEALTTLYTTLHHLGTLRSTARASDEVYQSSTATLKRELERLETEVGESRERRGVEKELELLSELQSNEGIERLLARCVEGLGRSGVLLEGIERAEGEKAVSEGIYPLQLLLAECSIKLGKMDVSSLPQLSTLLPSLHSLVELRLQVLTATRAKIEQDTADRRMQVAHEYEKLFATSLG